MEAQQVLEPRTRGTEPHVIGVISTASAEVAAFNKSADIAIAGHVAARQGYN